jgi:hypothetical protein
VNLPQSVNVDVTLNVRIVDQVIELGKSEITAEHDLATLSIQRPPSTV